MRFKPSLLICALAVGTAGDVAAQDGGGLASPSGPERPSPWVTTPPPTTCEGACCPTSEVCYGNGSDGPGAECLAQRDNTGQNLIQMRQTWIRNVAPVGDTIPIVYEVLKRGSELPEWDECNMSLGTSGYMRLTELGQETNAVTGAPSAIHLGFDCQTLES